MWDKQATTKLKAALKTNHSNCFRICVCTCLCVFMNAFTCLQIQCDIIYTTCFKTFLILQAMYSIIWKKYRPPVKRKWVLMVYTSSDPCSSGVKPQF